MKKFSLIAFLGGLGLILVGFGLPIFLMEHRGGIYGTDWEDYRFLLHHGLNGLPYMFVWLGGGLIMMALFYQRFHSSIAVCGTKQTTLVALALAAVGALGLFCAITWGMIVAFDKLSRYPVRYPVSLGLGLTCLAVFFVLIGRYVFLRRRCPSVKGILLDVAMICLAGFSFLFLFAIIAKLF